MDILVPYLPGVMLPQGRWDKASVWHKGFAIADNVHHILMYMQ
jgi:hypothetical protein